MLSPEQSLAGLEEQHQPVDDLLYQLYLINGFVF